MNNEHLEIVLRVPADAPAALRRKSPGPDDTALSALTLLLVCACCSLGTLDRQLADAMVALYPEFAPILADVVTRGRQPRPRVVLHTMN